MQEGKYIFDNHYRITAVGEIYSVYKKNTRLKTRIKQTKKGIAYEEVTLCILGNLRYFRVYELYAQAFIANPNGYETVKAIDGNYRNYAIDNFEWVDDSSEIPKRHKDIALVRRNYVRKPNDRSFRCLKCGKLTQRADHICNRCQRMQPLENALKSGVVDMNALDGEGKIVLKLFDKGVSYLTIGKVCQRGPRYTKKALNNPTTKNITDLSRFLIVNKAEELLSKKETWD